MPKVLYVLSTLAASGPVNQLYNIVSELGDDISVSILTLSPEPSTSRIDDFEPLVESVESLDFGRIESLIKGKREYKRFVEGIAPDIVHSHGLRADVLSAISRADGSTVTTLHTDPRYDYRLKYGRVPGRIAATIHLVATRRLDNRVACSETVARSVEASISRPRVIRNGIDANVFRPADDKISCRRSLNLPDEGPIFMTVSTFIDRKRPEMILRGFQSSEVEGTLVMVGEGPLLDSCRRAAGNSIVLPGYVENVRKYLQAADYFVSASAAEGLPLAVMEALGCGLPAALSNIAPHREILSIDRDAGVLFTGNDVVDCANSFATLYDEEYEKASTAARDIVVGELNAERMGKQYSSLYREITERSVNER